MVSRLGLRETERGHYALPLFEGFKSSMCKESVISSNKNQTQDVNAVEFSGSKVSAECPVRPDASEQNELYRCDADGRADGRVHSNSSDQRASGGGRGEQCGGSDERDPLQDPRRRHPITTKTSPKEPCPVSRDSWEGSSSMWASTRRPGHWSTFVQPTRRTRKYVAWIRKFIKRKGGSCDGQGQSSDYGVVSSVCGV